ncbi:hypothetical protein F5X68DRAFT_206932 [Plectosphaerella plurivora]|uniref:Secreted protein n=1 Tax=Plectosphaerella plurivora TaxID=936078 RepID=A0A9P8VBU8_9PEZI|nr:hypothetical protein F5X68DRAFT_206932 [Plectosphaerella plurivora]
MAWVATVDWTSFGRLSLCLYWCAVDAVKLASKPSHTGPCQSWGHYHSGLQEGAAFYLRCHGNLEMLRNFPGRQSAPGR